MQKVSSIKDKDAQVRALISAEMKNYGRSIWQATDTFFPHFRMINRR